MHNRNVLIDFNIYIIEVIFIIYNRKETKIQNFPLYFLALSRNNRSL